MRTLLLMILAAAIGVLAAVQITGALRQRDAYPRGVMDVMAHHAGRLDRAAGAQTCLASTTGRDFAMLANLSGDIPQAFPDLMKTDKHFAMFATDAHATMQSAAAAPPRECGALKKTLAQIGQRCDQCHQQYR